MQQSLIGQIKTASREKDELKKRFRELNKKLNFLEKYVGYAQDISLVRKQIERGETIAQEKLFSELGI